MSIVILDTEIAKIVGPNAAMLYERIRYYCEEAKDKNDNFKFHEGRFWTYNSAQGWLNSLPFLTARQINRALDILVSKGLIKVGNFNKSKYDRTRWYTILSRTESTILPVGEMDMPEKVKWKNANCEINLTLSANQFNTQVEPIPNESSNKSSNDVDSSKTDSTLLTKQQHNSVFKQEAHFKAQDFRDFFRQQKLYPRLKPYISNIAEDFGDLETLRDEMNRLAKLPINESKTDAEIIDFIIGTLINRAKA